MDKIVIEGGRRLEGSVVISGAKNAVLPIMAATLLTAGQNEIDGVPRVRDVITMLRLLNDLGARTESFEGTASSSIPQVSITMKHPTNSFLPCEPHASCWGRF